MDHDARTHLDGLLTQLDTQTERLRNLIAPLDDAALSWQPDPASWGVAQCCDHLERTGIPYHRQLRTALAGDLPKGNGRYRPSAFGRWFIRAAGPGAKPLKAFGALLPDAPDPEAPQRFLTQTEELRSIIEAVRDRDVDLQKVRIRTLLPLVSTQLGVVLTLLVAHDERHIDQAERVTRNEAFPA